VDVELPLVPAEGRPLCRGEVAAAAAGGVGVADADAAALVLRHQGLQVLAALAQLLAQDLVPPHLRPQLCARVEEQRIMGSGVW